MSAHARMMEPIDGLYKRKYSRQYLRPPVSKGNLPAGALANRSRALCYATNAPESCAIDPEHASEETLMFACSQRAH